MKNKKQQKSLTSENQEFDLEDIKYFMSLSLKQKLKYLEELNSFFQKHTPRENRKTWEILKQQGF